MWSLAVMVWMYVSMMSSSSSLVGSVRPLCICPLYVSLYVSLYLSIWSRGLAGWLAGWLGGPDIDDGDRDQYILSDVYTRARARSERE